MVWNSEDSHHEDPAYDPDNPDAYLDLGSELAGHINSVGSYYFKIVGFNAAEDTIKELPDMLVSIGVLLDDYPRNLNYNTSQLSWSAVPGANGYRVQIYDESETKVYDSTMNLLNQTYISVPGGLVAGQYYTWRVDSHALDTGWSAEITRGLSGFLR